MQIGLQYSIESLSLVDHMRERRRTGEEEKEREKERSVHIILIKNQPLREKREEAGKEKNERRREREKEDSRRKHCVYISLLPLVHDIPLSLTIKQQYQISSLATFLEHQVSISSHLYHTICIST